MRKYTFGKVAHPIWHIVFVLLIANVLIKAQYNDLLDSKDYEAKLSVNDCLTWPFSIDTDFDSLIVIGGMTSYEPILESCISSWYNGYIQIYYTNDHTQLTIWPSSPTNMFYKMEEIDPASQLGQPQDYFHYNMNKNKFVSAVRFPQIAWQQNDYTLTKRENSFFIAAVQMQTNWYRDDYILVDSTHQRGYNQIIFYETATANILNAFAIQSAVSPIQRQIAVTLKGAGFDSTQSANYNIFYVTTPSVQNYKDSFAFTLDENLIENGTQSSFGINCFQVSSTQQFQTQIQSSANDHRADSLIVWDNSVYLGGYFKIQNQDFIRMAIKKFQVDFTNQQITEEWTYAQSSNQVTGPPVYTVDLLEVDHVNTRIIGLSVPRTYTSSSSYQLYQSNEMLLHIIDPSSDTSINHIKTISINTVDQAGSKWYPLGILFNDNNKSMQLVFNYNYEELYSIKFPTLIDMNHAGAQYGIYLDNNYGENDTQLFVGQTETIIDWTDFQFTVNTYGGKTLSIDPAPGGDSSKWPYIMAVVPTSFAYGSSMIYVAKTGYQVYLLSDYYEDNYEVIKTSFEQNNGSIGQLNVGSEIYCFLVSTTQSSENTTPHTLTSLILNDKYQLVSTTDLNLVQSFHSCEPKINYCSGYEKIEQDATWSSPIQIYYLTLPYTIDFVNVIMPNYKVSPSIKTPLISGVYESIDPGSQLYSGNGISLVNQLDITFGQDYPYDGQTKSFYVWPKFEACKEFTTDICSSQSVMTSQLIFGQAIEFTISKLNCTTQMYAYTYQISNPHYYMIEQQIGYVIIDIESEIIKYNDVAKPNPEFVQSQGLCVQPNGNQVLQLDGQDQASCEQICLSYYECKSYLFGESGLYFGRCEIYDQLNPTADGDAEWSCYSQQSHECTDPIEWTLMDDINCTIPTTFDPNIVKIQQNTLNNVYELIIDSNHEIYDQLLYLCSLKTTYVQQFSLTIYPICNSVTFEKTSGNNFVIDIEQGSVQQSYDLMSLIKPSTNNTQINGPCMVYWYLCGDLDCQTNSSVGSNDMIIDLNTRSLIVNPSTLYSSEIVYLWCYQNQQTDFITVNYTVTEPLVPIVLQCQVDYPYGNKLIIKLDQQEDKTFIQTYTSYFQANNDCLIPVYKLCLKQDCSDESQNIPDSIKFEQDYLLVDQSKSMDLVTLYIVNTAETLNISISTQQYPYIEVEIQVDPQEIIVQINSTGNQQLDEFLANLQIQEEQPIQVEEEPIQEEEEIQEEQESQIVEEVEENEEIQEQESVQEQQEIKDTNNQYVQQIQTIDEQLVGFTGNFKGGLDLMKLKKAQEQKPKKPQNFKMKTQISKNGAIKLNFQPYQLLVSDKFQKDMTHKRRLDDNQPLFGEKRYVKLTEFGRNLKTNEELQNVFKLDVQPSQDRDPDETGDKLQFSYSSFTIENDNSIVIKVDFKNPEEMSMGDGYDQLKVSIDKSQFKKAFIILGDSDKIIELPADNKIDVAVNIPVQMSKDENVLQAQQQMESAKNQMQMSSIIQVLITYFLNAAMQLIWSALNILQIISFMTISKIKLPGNTSALFEQILSIVTFDIIPEEYYSPLIDYLFDDLPSDYFYHEQVAQAGFETGYILISMFLTFVFLFIFLLQMTYHYLVSKCCFKYSKCNKRAKTSAQKVRELPGEMIRLFIELCLDISVCGSIELIMRQTVTAQEKFSYSVSFILSSILISGLIYSTILIKSQKNKINYPDIYQNFHLRWSTIWEEQRIDYNSILPCFNLFFVLRRFLYTSILIHAVNFSWFTTYFQIIGILMLNFLTSCYLAFSQRFESKFINRIELFNESVNSLITIQFLSMLSISSGALLIQYGLYLNLSILGLFGSNVLIVAYNILKSIGQKLRQWWNRRSMKQIELIQQRKNKIKRHMDRLNHVKQIMNEQKIVKVKRVTPKQKNQIIEPIIEANFTYQYVEPIFEANCTDVAINASFEEEIFENAMITHLKNVQKQLRKNKNVQNDSIEITVSPIFNQITSGKQSDHYCEFNPKSIQRRYDYLNHKLTLPEQPQEKVRSQTSSQESQNDHGKSSKTKIRSLYSQGKRQKNESQVTKKPMQTIKETIETDRSHDI